MNIFKKLLKKDVFIFGTGRRCKKISTVLDFFGIPIEGYIDNDVAKHGIFLGKKCSDLSVLAENKNAFVVVSPVDDRAICEQLDKANIQYISGNEINKYYGFIPPKKELSDYCHVSPFNSYDSPYPDMKEIHDREAVIFDHNRPVLDINFNIKRQLELLEEMRKMPIIPWPVDKTDKYRFFYNNGMFTGGCADSLYYMMNIIRPKRIIEVGSGFSTAIMLDTNNNCFDNSIKIISIEPYTQRLRSLLRDNDNLEIHESNLQDIPLEFFSQLE